MTYKSFLECGNLCLQANDKAICYVLQRIGLWAAQLYLDIVPFFECSPGVSDPEAASTTANASRQPMQPIVLRLLTEDVAARNTVREAALQLAKSALQAAAKEQVRLLRPPPNAPPLSSVW